MTPNACWGQKSSSYSSNLQLCSSSYNLIIQHVHRYSTMPCFIHEDTLETHIRRSLRNRISNWKIHFEKIRVYGWRCILIDLLDSEYDNFTWCAACWKNTLIAIESSLREQWATSQLGNLSTMSPKYSYTTHLCDERFSQLSPLTLHRRVFLSLESLTTQMCCAKVLWRHYWEIT